MRDPFPDIDAFEERAAIIEFDGGYTRQEAEDLAAQGQGYRDAAHFWQVLAEYLASREL